MEKHVDTLETAEMLDEELTPAQQRKAIIRAIENQGFDYHLDADMKVVMHIEAVDKNGAVSIEYVKCPDLVTTFTEMGY